MLLMPVGSLLISATCADSDVADGFDREKQIISVAIEAGMGCCCCSPHWGCIQISSSSTSCNYTFEFLTNIFVCSKFILLLQFAPDGQRLREGQRSSLSQVQGWVRSDVWEVNVLV